MTLLKLRCQNCNHNNFLTSSPGTDYSPWDQGQVNWYQTGDKTLLPKISKFYVEKRYLVYVIRAHQQICINRPANV